MRHCRFGRFGCAALPVASLWCGLRSDGLPFQEDVFARCGRIVIRLGMCAGVRTIVALKADEARHSDFATCTDINIVYIVLKKY